MKITEDTGHTEKKYASLTGKVIAAAIEVHRATGPGLLESTYRVCLLHKLRTFGISVATEHPIPLVYKGVTVDCSYRADLFIENRLIVELKAVDHVAPVHYIQTLTYMKLANAPVGLLINFNVKLLKDGITRLSF